MLCYSMLYYAMCTLRYIFGRLRYIFPLLRYIFEGLRNISPFYPTKKLVQENRSIILTTQSQHTLSATKIYQQNHKVGFAPHLNGSYSTQVSTMLHTSVPLAPHLCGAKPQQSIISSGQQTLVSTCRSFADE